MTSGTLPILLHSSCSNLPVPTCTTLPFVLSLLWETFLQPFLGGQGYLSLPTTSWLPQAAQGSSTLPSWEHTAMGLHHAHL